MDSIFRNRTKSPFNIREVRGIFSAFSRRDVYMQSSKWEKIFVFLCLLLFSVAPGYCLFRDDVDPEQVKNKVRIQREKDKIRMQQSREKKKLEQNLKNSEQKTPHTQAAGVSKITAEGEKPAENLQNQYTRLSRQNIIKENSPQYQQNTAPDNDRGEKIVNKYAHKKLFIWVFLMIVIGGFFFYKRADKNK